MVQNVMKIYSPRRELLHSDRHMQFCNGTLTCKQLPREGSSWGRTWSV